ncbi:hypothetical protein TTHERM_00585130 (macronuclear) [Tetrahymena thermophila SB210]|uniref:EF-hand domain-containing protein n=1 Tax=Tetrahymena thermophila (strain SB210) TaxID=312017 RepID=I7MG99_TETTS|nr:hypothetical protein TTHERM_00585130 [Tetrahymena thermophila SB210]EAR84955.2 hypothetical protein TTHERM_00585130 [Tetrahymena thermophila SB210]|eukprot:XP_001032618.2 hypothetical protein TTHERM_00585130 [Tetrahymena thermophila SB210]
MSNYPTSPIVNKYQSNINQDGLQNSSYSKKIGSDNHETSDQISFFDHQFQKQETIYFNSSKKELINSQYQKQKFIDKRISTESSSQIQKMNELSQTTFNSINRKNSLNAEIINKQNKTDRSISVKQLNMKEYFSKILKKPNTSIKSNNQSNLSPYFQNTESSEKTDRKMLTNYEGFIPQQMKDKRIQNISKNKQDKNLLSEQKSLLNLVDKISNQSKEMQFNGKEEFLTSRSYIPSQIHNETMFRLNKLNVLPSIQTTPLNTNNIDFRNYSNLSSLENHKVNLIDQKIGEKEYYDTPLLSPTKINSIEACRLFKDQTLYQQFTTKGVEYNTDLEHIKKLEKTKIVNLLDINQIDISKEDAAKLLQSFQSSANKSNLHLPLHNKHKNVTSRKDVEDLEQWLNYMTLQVLSNKQLDGSSLFQTLQQIFCACLNELIRQVSLQCLERGSLIRRVWESYIGLFSKIIQVKSEESSKIEGQSLAEATRLHKNYQNQINQLSHQLNETQKNYEQAKEKNKRLKFLNQQQSERVKFFEGQSVLKINEINELKYNISVLQNENQRIFSYVKEMGILDDSKLRGNKIQQEFLESFTKSQQMSYQSGLINQFSLFERADKSPMSKLEFKNNKIKRSLSLNFGDDEWLQENKLIKENEKRELYYRLKSDICILSTKNDISKSDENNKGVDTQELNEFAQQDLQKLDKYVKILKSQLYKSKKTIQTLQQQQQQKEEKIKTSSRSIQNSSHHSKQKSNISESQRHISKQSVNLQLVCTMCQQKQNEQNDYTPSPNRRKASNFNFNKDSEMNLINKNSFLETISPYSEKKEIQKRKVSNTSQINSTKSNNMQSLQHIQEEEKDFLNANQDQDRSLKSNVSSQKIKSIIIIDKSSKQISKANIQSAKSQQSLIFDKKIKQAQSVISNQMIKSKSNIQEYENFLNEFYQEANQYLNLEIKQEKESINTIAKILDQINSQNSDTNIKQFLEHFAKARSYLNEKLKESKQSSIQNNIQVPVIEINQINNNLKQTPKNNKQTKTQKKNPNNLNLNVSKSSPRKSILFTQPNNISRSNQSKNQPLQQQQQSQQVLQQSSFRVESQKLNIESEEINNIQNEIKRVPSIIEDVENETLQLEIQKIKNTLEFYHQLILDILNHINIEPLPEELQLRIKLWMQQYAGQNVNNFLQQIEFQLNNSDKNKKMLNQSLVSKSNFNIDGTNNQNSHTKKEKSSYNIEQLKSLHSFNKFNEVSNSQNHKNNHLKIISDKELNLTGTDDSLSFSKLPQINFQNSSPTKQGIKTVSSIESPHTNQHKQKQKFFNYDEKKQKRGSVLFSQNQFDQYDNFNDYESGGQNVVLYAKKGKKKSDKGAVSINQEASYKLVQSIVDKQKISQIKPHMSKFNLIKFISVVYQERIRIAQNYNNMIYTIAYDYLLNKYGLKRVAEKKLSQYLETCYFYQDIPRVKLFGNFMQLYSENECFDKDEFNFYISILKLMDEKTNTGLGLVQTFNERILCSFEKVIEYMQLNFSNDSQKKNDQILRQIQQIAINVGNQLFVDIDQTFKIIVSLYQNKKEEIENNVKKLFYAADLDKNDCIELNEFITIYRYLESETFNSNEVQNLFINSADMVTCEGEKAFSLDRFAAVCLDYQLFSLQKQQQFSQAFSQLDYVQSIEDLTKNFHKKFREIKARLQFANQYTSQFIAIIDSICQLIQPQNIQDNANKDMLWISYRLLDEESKRLYLEQLSFDLLSAEFHQLQQVYSEIDQNLI